MKLIYFCRNCAAVQSDVEELSEAFECNCANCGETTNCIPGQFDDPEYEAFWKAYNNV